MNPRILIRPAADTEIDEQATYIAEENLGAAIRFLNAAEQTFNELAESPGLGRKWESPDERLEGIRVWRVQGFENRLIFYRPIKQGIEVLHVFHGARDLPNLLGQHDP